MSEDVYYRHLRGVNNHPFATLCANVIPATGTAIGASVCSDKDQFSYGKGRSISHHRMKAIERGVFPKQLAVFVPEITDRNDCIKLISRLQIEHDGQQFKIIDPEHEYEMIYEDTVEPAVK